jgi:hypothetical protein
VSSSSSRTRTCCSEHPQLADKVTRDEIVALIE